MHDHDLATEAKDKKSKGDSLQESIRKMNEERALQMARMAEAKRAAAGPMRMSNNPAAAIAAMHGLGGAAFGSMMRQSPNPIFGLEQSE